MRVSRSRSFFLTLCLVLSALVGQALGDTFHEYRTRAARSLKNRQWEVALHAATQGIKSYEGTKQLYGPAFGSLYFYKGFAELRLKRYEDAATSFQTCYEKFPSIVKVDDDQKGGRNIFHKKALLRWAEALQRDKKYKKAISIYNKFLKERDKNSPTDKYDRGTLFIDFGICYLKQEKPDFPKGIEYLETAIKNKINYRVASGNIMRGFRALVESSIKHRREQSLMDFLDRNRADLQFEPHEAHPYSPIFMSEANKAYKEDLFRTALVLYSLVPSTEEVLNDVKAKIQSFSPRARVPALGRQLYLSELNKQLDVVSKQMKATDPDECIALQATAIIHTKMGSVRNAYAAYEQLENFFPKSKRREYSLYQLVLKASAIGEAFKAEKYGRRFLVAFPGSEYEDTVRRVMLMSLFQEGEFAKCIEVAEAILPQLKEGTDEHDMALYVLGGSFYYEARYDDAIKPLEKHVSIYEKSKYRMSVLYFQAANYVRLQEWDIAAKKLDAFLAAYPDAAKNPYLDRALLDRANVHYAKEEAEQALANLNRIEKDFSNSVVIQEVYNLKGNILQAPLEQYEEAVKYYEKALTKAEARGDRYVASEALSYLVGLLGEDHGEEKPNRMPEALPYYKKYFDEYAAGGLYNAQVAVLGLPAMRNAGKGEEGLERLRFVILDLAKRPSGASLEAAIGSYTEYYLKDSTPEKLLAHYSNFGINPNNKSALALLRFAIIGVYEEQKDEAVKKKDKKAIASIDAKINAFFEDMKIKFKPKELSSLNLIQLGDFLRVKTNSPRGALPYYEEILSRKGETSQLLDALYGAADILAQGSGPEGEKALEYLNRIIRLSESRKEKEKALYRIVLTHSQQKNWKKVVETAIGYLDAEREGGRYRNFSPKVSLLLAQAQEADGLIDEAIVSYSNVFGALPPLRIAVPAYLAWTDLLWAKGDQRQETYDVLELYVRAMGRNYDRMVDDDKALFDTLRERFDEYEGSGLIKTYEQQQAEKKK